MSKTSKDQIDLYLIIKPLVAISVLVLLFIIILLVSLKVCF